MNIQTSIDSDKLKLMCSQLQQILQKIYSGKSKEVNFQDSYRLLFALHQNEYRKTIQQVTENKLKQIFKEKLCRFGEKSAQIGNMINQMNPLLESIQKMMKIYNFIENNYYLSECGISLRAVSLQILKEQLICKQSLFTNFLNNLIEHCFLIKTNGSNQKDLLKRVIQLMFKLDGSKLLIFKCYFKKFYMKYLSQFNSHLIQLYIEKPIQEYMKYFVSLYDRQMSFLNQYFIQKNIKQDLNQIVKVHFVNWIIQNSKYLLEKEDTVKALLVTNPSLVINIYKFDQKTFNQFSEWYIAHIKLKLSKLDQRDNNNLIKSFVNLYKDTVNQTQLSFKSKIAFQFWLNKQELNIVNRLNYFISQFITTSNTNKQNINQDNKTSLEQILIVFKLVKDKDLFEKGYRKMLVERSITARQLNFKQQQELVKLMQKECGECWGNKINGIIKECQDNVVLSKKDKFKIFSQTNWPYDNECIQKIKFCQQLISYKKKFEAQYIKLNPTKMLKWHPYLGNGVIRIKFQKNVYKNFTLSTIMMNILLCFNKKSNITVEDLIKTTNYKLQMINQSLFCLIKNNLVLINKQVNDPSQIRYSLVLSLNTAFQTRTDQIHINLNNQLKKFDIVKKQQLGLDRKLMVQCIIIKIIKQKKNIPKDLLFEMINQSVQKKGFSPNQQFVYACFKDLLTRDYIKDHQDGTYGYLA